VNVGRPIFTANYLLAKRREGSKSTVNDLRILRDRQWAAREVLDSGLGGADVRGSSAMLAQTTTVKAYPTTAAAFYAVVPCDIDGVEVEGAAATYVPRTGSVAYAFNLGTQIPPSDTTVVCHADGGRWCFRYDG
jgi:hypothetical protein